VQGAKKELIDLIKALPADASLEDIRGEYESFIGVLEGIQKSQAGNPAADDVVLAEVRAKLAERKPDQPTIVPVPHSAT
jgi:hypothetical protein